MTGALSPVHWLIIVGVLVVLFGAKKLPDLARSVGQSARVFHSEIRELSNESAGRTAGGPETAATAEERRPAA
ncbi:Sec-independent protein translocase subunit TatA [Actinomycetospora endophytica]|uniref:Sec-independent protein translocase protein TatA n=1 Tax=Actinomycetospora endophytica TaxID=2291215 RepID=A0ABS8PA93_9PSEU|nr:Sec-independent protein translocase subunit TatA [Actinomycetospora endophytica]MCD2195164.1 Sec-independent protein translocase subunit TatA [Actinomycetospora endophytica]